MYDEMHGMGFRVINMDLIPGLPGETAEDVARHAECDCGADAGKT